MGSKNQISHYGKPLIGIVLAWAGLVGLALGLGGEVFRSAAWVWLSVLYVHWVVITYLIWLTSDLRQNSLSLPAVKAVQADDGIILVTQKDWLGVSVSILLYKQESEFERLLCAGTVTNVQGNGLIQISLITSTFDQAEQTQLKSRLTDGKLDSLIVKPGQSLVE